MYLWQNTGTNLTESEHHFGLIDANNNPKAAWYALAEQFKILQKAHFKGFKTPLVWPQVGMVFQTPQYPFSLETLSLWSADDSSGTLLIVPKSKTQNHTARFSNNCQALQLSDGWMVRVGASPCFAQIQGGWR